MDYEEFGNFSNATVEEATTSARVWSMTAHEIIFVIFCLIGVCADVLIIYTMFRFKRLRTVPNFFVANWAIADVCSLIVTPSGYRLISIYRHVSISPEFTCTISQLGAIFHLTVLIFVMLVSLDWFLAAYFTKASEKLRRYHKFIIATIWMFCVIFSGITTGLCMEDDDIYYGHTLVFGSFWVILVATILLQSSRAVRKYCLKKPIEYPTLMLTLTTSVVGSWILSFIFYFLDAFIPVYSPLTTLVVCFFFATSVVNLTLLYWLDKDFQACLLQTLKRNGSGYEESISDFRNPVYKVTVVKDKVLLEKQNELLINDECY